MTSHSGARRKRAVAQDESKETETSECGGRRATGLELELAGAPGRTMRRSLSSDFSAGAARRSPRQLVLCACVTLSRFTLRARLFCSVLPVLPLQPPTTGRQQRTSSSGGGGGGASELIYRPRMLGSLLPLPLLLPRTPALVSRFAVRHGHPPAAHPHHAHFTITPSLASIIAPVSTRSNSIAPTAHVNIYR